MEISAQLSIKVACIRIGVGLSKENDNPQFISFAVKTLPEAISETTEPTQLLALAGALETVVGVLGPEEAQKVSTHLVAIIERTTEPGQLDALARALKVMIGGLAPAEAQKLSIQLISMIEHTTNPQQFRGLTRSLKVMIGGLAPAEAQKVSTHLIAMIERTADPYQDMALIGTLRAVQGKIDPQQLISLLKWPTSVGILRSTLLSLLEEQAGQKFDNNLWKMVTWAQANSFDVKSPPKRPDK